MAHRTDHRTGGQTAHIEPSVEQDDSRNHAGVKGGPHKSRQQELPSGMENGRGQARDTHQQHGGHQQAHQYRRLLT